MWTLTREKLKSKNLRKEGKGSEETIYKIEKLVNDLCVKV